MSSMSFMTSKKLSDISRSKSDSARLDSERKSSDLSSSMSPRPSYSSLILGKDLMYAIFSGGSYPNW
jgi:hypothetical protein